MVPHGGPSHAYEGSVEYPSADSFRPRTANRRILSHTTRSQDDVPRMTTASYTSRRQAVGIQAYHPTTSNRGSPALRNPTLQDLQMTPITRVASSSGTDQEPSRLPRARPVGELRQATLDDFTIFATERGLGSKILPASWRHPWSRRDVVAPPPRYEDTSHRGYLPRLYAAYLRHALGFTYKANMRGLIAGLPLWVRSDVAQMLRADSMGTNNEADVRRTLTSFNVMPPEDGDAVPVPTYEELWEERYDERFGWGSVPAYEA